VREYVNRVSLILKTEMSEIKLRKLDH